MLVVSTWSDCQTHLPLGMCDAHVCIDEFARLASDDTRILREFDDEIPTSAVGHAVLVVKNSRESLPLIERWLKTIAASREIRLLASPGVAQRLSKAGPISGLVVENTKELADALFLLPDINGSNPVIYLEASALNPDCLHDLRETILANPLTNFVFSGFGGKYWRFAMLLCTQATNVILDTARLTPRRLRAILPDRYQVARILNQYYHRIIFASGFPVARPLAMLQIMLPWFASRSAMEWVMRENALRLYFGRGSVMK